ncbi:MAG: YjcQ family protein [Finegoldia sp.]|nr:YjcQ family protein [Finegoldia sp.]
MAKDDYFVIVYKILAYLYTKLKSGEAIEPEYLMYDGVLFDINRKYWTYIVADMVESGYITGLSNVRVADDNYLKYKLRDCEITPKGIEYLCENSTLEKAKKFLKEVKDITPFI